MPGRKHYLLTTTVVGNNKLTYPEARVILSTGGGVSARRAVSVGAFCPGGSLTRGDLCQEEEVSFRRKYGDPPGTDI